MGAYTYGHLRRYMRVFAYTFNVVPNIFCLDSQKMSTDAQKAFRADGYWSRQIINSKPISFNHKAIGRRKEEVVRPHPLFCSPFIY